MRILVWYAHGSYVNALVRGGHDYLVLDRDLAGRPVPPTSQRPAHVSLVDRAALAADPPDLVVVQRLEEISYCTDVLGLALGRRVPALFLEHNLPKEGLPSTRHPLADHDGWWIVHVTQVNALLWDCGATPTAVVPHGIPDPGPRYTGTEPRAAFVVNEPVRRFRVSGADMLPTVAGSYGVDVFGIAADLLPAKLPGHDVRYAGDLPATELHDAMARLRVYLHLNRWTSLGLSLLEAMHLELPVVVLAMTEAATLPDEIGAVSPDPARLRRRVAELMADPDEAARCGRIAREVVLRRHDFGRFLSNWDQVFADVVARFFASGWRAGRFEVSDRG